MRHRFAGAFRRLRSSFSPRTFRGESQNLLVKGGLYAEEHNYQRKSCCRRANSGSICCQCEGGFQELFGEPSCDCQTNENILCEGRECWGETEVPNQTEIGRASCRERV